MNDFHRILAVSKELSDEHDGLVFIGGVAVYLHSVNGQSDLPKEASHDSDFMISIVDFSSLRDSDEVTSNERLIKHQFVRNGVEFDIYVERRHGLAIPYDEAIAHSVDYDGMKVACLEHLLILKLDAFCDRKGTAKGDKDARDLVVIAGLFDNKVALDLVEPFLRDEHFEGLKAVARSSVFTTLSGGNAHQAKKLRWMFDKFIALLR